MSNDFDKKNDIKILLDWRNSLELFVFDNFGVRLDAWQKKAAKLWDEGHIQIALCACKGPGKTAFLSWAGWHFLSLRPHSNVIVTSISGDNLRDGYWKECAIWMKKSKFLSQAFEWQKERIISLEHPETWWMSARKWSADADEQKQADTLAGVHNDYILFVIDEAGAVPVPVMVAAKASLASGVETRMIIAGNPTQRDGALADAVLHSGDQWQVVSISSDPDDPDRTPRVNKGWARGEIIKYGRDHRWVVANIFGRFPEDSDESFFPESLIEEASTRELVFNENDPVIIGVDPSFSGAGAKSVIYARRGNDARSMKRKEFRGIDGIKLALEIEYSFKEHKASALFVDGAGVGASVCDQIRNYYNSMSKVFRAIQFGSSSDHVPHGDKFIYYGNKRAEMYGKCLQWLDNGGCIPNDPELKKQFQIKFKYVQRSDGVYLFIESKEELKKRGVPSPDALDALVTTFAYPVYPISMKKRSIYENRSSGSLGWMSV